MLQEALEAPQVVARQLKTNRLLLTRLAGWFQQHRPPLIATSARGSSENAAVYARYLIETRLGLPVRSSAPSVGGLYRPQVVLKGSVMLCISQSGASFDLVEDARWAKRQGARVISLLNTPDSPLGEVSDVIIPLGAGTERSIAATKSHIASLSALLQLVAHLANDRQLLGVLDGVPEELERASELDWSKASEVLSTGRQLYIAGRGLGLGVAREAALKFKEACGVHAEAFSGAELMHGPVALLRPDDPVLLFAQSDETQASSAELAARLRNAGAIVFTAGLSRGVPNDLLLSFGLPVVQHVHPTVAPLTMVQTCYGLIECVAGRRGWDPDQPPHLFKVTRTR
jgi:glucosamine--fructose-6-phosphate aminotransferase (isomerizing)